MGANCCVAVKGKSRSDGIRVVEVSGYRSGRHSPSWSFLCDNRTHIEDIMDNSSRAPRSIHPEVNSKEVSEVKGLPDQTCAGSTSSTVSTPILNLGKKVENPRIVKLNPLCKVHNSNRSNGNASSPEIKEFRALPGTETAIDRLQHSSSLPSSPLYPPFGEVPGFRGKVQCSPGHRSDSILSLKSAAESPSPDRRQSSSSIHSDDFSARGSHFGSSDGWSMRTFSELVSSQIERCSVDSELLVGGPNPDVQVCRICTKFMTERSLWSMQDLPVVAILVCGHSFHADCLDGINPATNKYDPLCPICAHGEKFNRNLFVKIDSKIKKVLKNTAAEDMGVSTTNTAIQKRCRKGLSPTASSSMKIPSGPPFFMRLLSAGGKRPGTASCGESSTRKRSWTRYKKH